MTQFSAGEIYEDKYPVVLPYHPKRLSIITDGMWIDKNTFFVFRINGYSLPSEYAVETIIPKEESSNKKYNGDNSIKRKPPKHELENGAEIPIVENENPHTDAGRFSLRTQVEFIDDEDLEFSCEIDTKAYDPNAKVSYLNDEHEEITALSSGDENSQNSSKGVAKIEIEEILPEVIKEQIKNSLGLKGTIDALSELCRDDISKLKEVVYIGSKATLHEDPILCSFKGVEDKYSTTWIYHKIKMSDGSYMDDESRSRGCLIAKLILEDGRIAYLLEIEFR